MFLRATNRKKDGKDHRYFSIVENRRVPGGKTVQRTVLYLGEINDQQQAGWRKTLEVFDEQEQRYTALSLFPEDREIPADAVNSVQVKLSGLELRRPRIFGHCWLACELWQQLGLDEFWQARLPEAREAVSWEKVLRLLVVNRLLDPGSEFRVHRQWFVDSAMDELLGSDFTVAEKDRLYRCLDRILAHKQELFVWLKQKWADLFAAHFEVLLYDLTSTYFEGEMEQNPKAKRGYSRDGRGDCLQLVIALVITPDGFPLAYEVMKGNTSDRTTLPAFLKTIESSYGKAQRVWVMDRGIPSEAQLKGNAGTRAANLLPGRYAEREDPSAREEVVGSAVAESPRIGGSKVIRARGRTVRARQKPGSASQRDCHPSQAPGTLTAQATGYAEEPTHA